MSEGLKISHEAEEMASHAAGRKYNVTSGQIGGGARKPTLAIQGNWQLKCAVPKVCASKSLSTGNCLMESKVSRQFRKGWKDPFFPSRNCVFERTVSPSGSTSGHAVYKALMQIIRQ